MKYRLILSCVVFLLNISALSGQYYETGQDPAYLKWLQIKTDHFTVIYPESYGQGGIKFAKSLDESFNRLSVLYSVKKVRIPVVIHNYTTHSNGYVAWAPRRVEIYPTPEQNTIPLDPVEQLTIHEMTHVFQMYSLKKGFSNAMTFVFGEQFTGIISVMLPLWFLEGDAVFAESVLSESGRGRIPAFQKQLKAISLGNDKMYNYDKMLNGSFRNYVPDHYQYGYQMLAWSHSKYDMHLWNKTLDLTARQPFTLNPVNLSLNRTAGLTKAKLFSETFDSLKILWQKDDSGINPVNYEILNPPEKQEYVNYYSVVSVGRDSIVAIKTSMSASPSFVLINTIEKTERRIHTPGEIYPWFLSGANGRLVWVEKQPDPRWENRNYSVIKIMDIKCNRTRQLTRKSRFLSASISPDGRMIAASENSADNKNSVVIIDVFTGEIHSKIPTPGNIFPQRPQWSSSGSEISIISLSDEGEGVMVYSLAGQTWETLIEAGRDDLQAAYLSNDTLFFVSSFSGTDNIYILTPGEKITKLTNSRFGAYDPCVYGNNLLFSDYSSSGYNISQINLKDAFPSHYNNAPKASFLINRSDTLLKQIPGEKITTYKPVPYNKWQHFFRFHSWMPFYSDIEKIQADPIAVSPGITLMTQNHLSTFISSFGYEYSDRSHKLHSRITWKGWYPVLESNLDWGDDPVIAKLNNPVSDPLKIYPGFGLTNSIYLPLTFSSGKFSQHIRFSVTSNYYNRYIYLKEKDTYDYGQTFFSGRIYILNYQRTAIRDIYPKWAQVFDFNYAFTPFDKELYGPVQTLKTIFFFPGLVRNHGIMIRFETEKQIPETLILSNRSSFPRGYSGIISEKLKFLSTEYSLPLLYPDLNIPSLLYIKRIRTSFFYDYSRGAKNRYFNFNGELKVFHNYAETFRSFGFELLSDFYLLRIPFMISAGIRSSWKNLSDSPSVELLFNIDIFGMKIGRSSL